MSAAARRVVLHVDDVGMCHGANVAFLELARAGAVTSGAVMVPCPWFMEIAAAASAEPALDLGVHLTLTSEWPQYRWRPLSTVSRASGLIDDDGYFWRNCLQLRERVVPEAAEAELRLQIERALACGIAPTHLDAHMGAALAPELFAITLRLGREYRLPALLPRDFASYTRVLKLGEFDPAPQIAAAADSPIVEFRMTPGVASDIVERTYRSLLTTVPEGTTYVALHCNAPGDIETIVPPRAHWRTDEYRLFGSGAPRRWLAEAGIEAIGMRPLLDALRATPSG